MNKYKLPILIILLFSLSCMSQKREIVKKSTIKLEKEGTNIREYLNIDGFFLRELNEDRKFDDIPVILFFEDGTVCTTPRFKDGTTQEEATNNLSASLRIGTTKTGEKYLITTSWGVYKIEDNVITIYTYMPGALLSTWGFGEEEYRIIDRNTIERLTIRSLLDDKFHPVPVYSCKDKCTYHYIPTNNIPTFTPWIKEEKWLWKNKQDWEDYMRSIKKKK